MALPPQLLLARSLPPPCCCARAPCLRPHSGWGWAPPQSGARIGPCCRAASGLVVLWWWWASLTQCGVRLWAHKNARPPPARAEPAPAEALLALGQQHVGALGEHALQWADVNNSSDSEEEEAEEAHHVQLCLLALAACTAAAAEEERAAAVAGAAAVAVGVPRAPNVNKMRHGIFLREEHMFRMSDADFERVFRVDKGTIVWLTEHTKDSIYEFRPTLAPGYEGPGRPAAFTPLQAVAAAVLRLAGGDSFAFLNLIVGASVSTVARYITDCVIDTWASTEWMRKWVAWPSAAELYECSVLGYVMSGGRIAGAVGGVDSRHFSIAAAAAQKRSHASGHAHHYTVHYQPVVLNNRRVAFFNAGSAGSQHDARVWSGSVLGRLLRVQAFEALAPADSEAGADEVPQEHQEQYGGRDHVLPDPFFILGDAGFAREPPMLTPFTFRGVGVGQDLPADAVSYNHAHSAVRSTIAEGHFGTLVSQWRSLLDGRKTSENTVTDLRAAVVLHNIWLHRSGELRRMSEHAVDHEEQHDIAFEALRSWPALAAHKTTYKKLFFGKCKREWVKEMVAAADVAAGEAELDGDSDDQILDGPAVAIAGAGE